MDRWIDSEYLFAFELYWWFPGFVFRHKLERSLLIDPHESLYQADISELGIICFRKYYKWWFSHFRPYVNVLISRVTRRSNTHVFVKCISVAVVADMSNPWGKGQLDKEILKALHLHSHKKSVLILNKVLAWFSSLLLFDE